MIKILGGSVSTDIALKNLGEQNAPLSLDKLRLVLPHADDGAFLQQALVHHVVHLSGQHALYVVLHIAENDAVPLGCCPRGFRVDELDVKTLQHWDGVLDGSAVAVVENDPDSR